MPQRAGSAGWAGRAIVVALALAASPALGAGTGGRASGDEHPPAQPGAVWGDAANGARAVADVVDRLHAANRAEIEAGRAMQRRGRDARVRDFARKMVEDHRDLDRKLAAFARKKGIDLRTTDVRAPEEERRARRQHVELEALAGATADRRYVAMMVEDHQRDVDLVEAARRDAKRAHEEALASLLDDTAKELKEHLKGARKLERALAQRQARPSRG